MSDDLLTIPAGDARQGFVAPDVSETDGVGVLPQAEADWAASRDAVQEADTLEVEEAEHELATEIREERLDHETPKLSSINPAWAKVGDEDLVLSVYGNGFTEASVILWNGSAEPTTLVSPTEVTTGVKPSTAWGPSFCTVSVEGAEGEALFEFKE